jgi:hypothetical protein
MKHKKPFIVYCLIFFFCNICSSYSASLNENKIVKTLIFPPPPVNDICAGATEIGIIDCEYSMNGQWYPPDPEATPDPKATGNCISNSDPGLWYTFTTMSTLLTTKKMVF